ncbi:uncharacterized protein LOC111029281 [Myzus persicae]|uniref:uncharacterized protein LOC111029281 n=1 Tax=Myzus persicae TaxID=13164 RepID=UPI000B936247|nr:uncharacterized protein LOC111029281 [Myzus persicae]
MDFNRCIYHYNMVIGIAEAFGQLDPQAPDRKYWVYPINSNRESSGQFDSFYENIRCYPDKFLEYYRMSITTFDELLEKICPYITKQTTPFRNPITAEQRLTITLR